MLFSLAARNVMRNPRRTVITLAGITIGVAAMVFIAGFAGGFVTLLTSVLSEGRLGAIQVHRRGFVDEENDPLKLAMPQSAEFERKLAGVPGVRAVSGRISFEAMLSNGSDGAIALVTAVDPLREALVCRRRWEAVKGHAFKAARNDDVLVGRVLLEAMEGKPGDALMVTATTRHGGNNALDVHVENSLGATDMLQSKRRVEMTLAHAQELLEMQGQVTEYALAVDEDAPVEDVAARVRAAIGNDYEVHTWMDLASDLADVMRTIAFIMAGVVLMLVLLVLAGVANTMLMAVHERTREIGTMLAVGMRRRRVMWSFVLEAVVLGVLGGVVGALVGYALVQLVHAVGFPVKPPGSDVDNYLRPIPNAGIAAAAALIEIAGAAIAALWPARRAARLSPVEALRNE